ncbi:hypothetical protein FVR03_04850 [Pontibacter qinzhouensis]|uniref:Uncharacterized protein n=1 Tax=Pontibacter qinzhouensis TaxID=2603253 RepID=A0A5C8KC37_9BACT|nr:hypothetical protein [Pontibacter qinzhouensis]TXK50515.1 hypothetical protein FVR03_04850 [Pontibacter qinzhouensis]
MMDQEKMASAVFQQICEVNDLNPTAIAAAMEESTAGAGKLAGKTEAEKLIWTALDQRARVLLQQPGLDLTAAIKGDGGEYAIDPDPAAPAFVIQEDTIRSKHGQALAEKLIEALGQVKLPVQG